MPTYRISPFTPSSGVGESAHGMVQELVGRLQSDGLGWIGLVAEAGTLDFYLRIGFADMPGSILMLKKNL